MSDAVSQCEVEGCERPPYRRGMCQRHYRAGLRNGSVAVVKGTKGTPPRRRGERPPVPPVVADVAWPDTHPGAPGGQRLVLYTCPACGRQHLVGWLPFDEHPGYKVSTCREKSATQNAPVPQFYVLAPAVVLDGPPAGYGPASKPGDEPEPVKPGPEPQTPRSVRVA